MKQRCFYRKGAYWENYGGRGISVCKRWLGPRGFANFLADMGPRPPNRSLDRKKNNRGYSPKNCRWATYREQRLNQNRMK